MENNTEMLELLKKMEKTNRQHATYAKLQFFFSVAAVVLCLVLLISVLQFIPQVQQMLSRADIILTNLEVVSDQLTNMDLSGMVANVDSLVSNVDSLIGNVDGLVTTSQASLEDTLQNISQINFETLNKAIEDLSDVIEPLARFFNAFNR